MLWNQFWRANTIEILEFSCQTKSSVAQVDSICSFGIDETPIMWQHQKRFSNFKCRQHSGVIQPYPNQWFISNGKNWKLANLPVLTSSGRSVSWKKNKNFFVNNA